MSSMYADAPLVTTAMAARETGVVPNTIRKWVQLQHLSPAGRSGRAHLFRLEDVFAAERATRRAHEIGPDGNAAEFPVRS
ncbi:MerR family transcriptional regulator [Streptomyces varsoviensis]|uniref:HTH merR-type domain-containing protein n=1 Tax=Streptomyces varsoviensis TaxID=67373 RepID=A0ABR5J836_9ACTN|nr:DNA-binding protein [Streptomyces varsoviensis]KOG89526.1 hypothetical protein ADK38_13840 [Streptomyces varsoviensis]